MRDLIEAVHSDLVYFPQYPPEVAQHVEDFIEQLQRRGYLPEAGRTRLAMIAPDHKTVIKIPITDRGITDNSLEAHHFARQMRGREWVQIAACRIFYADRDIGVPMLMMRFVHPLDADDAAPDWSHFVDCHQIGKNARGEIVAYDL